MAHDIDKKIGKLRYAYLEHNSVLVFSFPEPMNYMNLDQRSYVLVKVAHEVFNIMEIIELPAFRDEWIAKKIMKTDGIHIGRCW